MWAGSVPCSASSRSGLRAAMRGERTMPSSDLTRVDWVEVVWDAKARRLWVNTPDGNVFRAYHVKAFHYRETLCALDDGADSLVREG
jgi:hypothetical protein